MIANAIIEMTALTPGMTRAVAAVQTTAQAPQAFSESLLAAAKTYSKPFSANEGTPMWTSRPRSTSEDARVPGSLPKEHSPLSQRHDRQMVVTRQVILQKSVPTNNPVLITGQALFKLPVSSSNLSAMMADQPMQDVAAERETQPNSADAQTGMLQLASYPRQTSTMPWGVTNGSANAPILGAGGRGNEVSNAVVTAPSNPLLDPDQGVGTKADPDGLRASTPGAVSGAASNSILSADPAPTLRAALNAAPMGAEWSGLAIPAEDTPQVAQTTSSNEVPNAGVTTASNATRNQGQDAIATTIPDRAQDLTSGIVPSVVSSFKVSADLAPALRAALNAGPTRAAAAVLKAASADRVLPPAMAPDESVFTGSRHSASGTAADQLAAFPQPGGLLVTGQAGDPQLSSGTVMEQSHGPAATGKEDSKSETKGAAGIGDHAQTAPNQSESRTGSQESTTPGAQSQSGDPSQGQSAAPAPIQSFAVIAHAQNSANGPAVQVVPTIAAGTNAAAKVEGNPAPVSTAVPQALPVINSAKLIQSMGQSEMRVGMRSSEFGNISISTSSTRGLISAQISVDHGELAKTIAASLPEMQARLGGNQAVNVRIDVNGAGTGPGAGTSSGMPSGTADQSRGGRQRAENPASGYSDNGVAERQSLPVAAVMTGTGGRLNSRLDIRV